MVTVSNRTLNRERRRIERRQMDLLALGIIVALIAVVALFAFFSLTFGRAARASRMAAEVKATPTAVVLPSEEPLLIPITDGKLWEPESLPPEVLASLAPEPVPLENVIEAEPTAPPVRYPLTAEERDLVERVVMAEAGCEDFDGKCLVAQCILNTCEARGLTPTETVTEKHQYTKPAAEASDSVKQAVAAVFDDGYTVTMEPVRWFYAPKYSEGRWHESALVFVLEHGGHRFFKEAGA